MKRKIMTSVFCAGLLATSANAVDTNTYSNNYSTVLTAVKIKKINKLVSKANDIYSYTKLYVLQTGDINPTLDKIKNYFHLPDNIFKNFGNGNLNLSVNNSENYLTIANIFNNTPNKIIDNYLKSNQNLADNANVTSDDRIIYKYDKTIIKFINNIKLLPSGVYLSATAPGDITKIWYQPDGKGNINVNKFDNTYHRWINIGVLSKVGIVVDKESDLSKYSSIAKTGQEGYVKDGDYLDVYVFNGSSWQKVTANF